MSYEERGFVAGVLFVCFLILVFCTGYSISLQLQQKSCDTVHLISFENEIYDCTKRKQ